ncbi:MAG: DUF177 domain-containing protein [Comamonas sp.]|nr:DUF177 domain-containing protein [Comamonas sp.]
MSKEPKAFNAQHIDIAAFARGQESLAQQTSAAAFPRLAEELQGDPAAQPVAWQAQGQWHAQTGGAGQPWLDLAVQATVTLTCQRCLQPVEVPLDVQRAFRFVKDEATAEVQDEESEEDLLVISRDFDLHALIEDELLMELPLVPRHEQCPQPLVLNDAATPAQEVQERPNPFAVLAQLRQSPDAPGDKD